eukprot:COSAG02_NODE_856_length_16468_cov_131.787831_21_plen_384_part_01
MEGVDDPRRTQFSDGYGGTAAPAEDPLGYSSGYGFDPFSESSSYSSSSSSSSKYGSDPWDGVPALSTSVGEMAEGGDGQPDTSFESNRVTSWLEQGASFDSSGDESSSSFSGDLSTSVSEMGGGDGRPDDESSSSFSGDFLDGERHSGGDIVPWADVFEADEAWSGAGSGVRYTLSAVPATGTLLSETREDTNPVWDVRPRAASPRHTQKDVAMPLRRSQSQQHATPNLSLTSIRTANNHAPHPHRLQSSEPGRSQPEIGTMEHGTSSHKRRVHPDPTAAVHREDVARTLELASMGSRRSEDVAQRLWESVEVLLYNETYKFSSRPSIIDGDRGVFREDTRMVRRGGVFNNHTRHDKWESSGGKKGSTVWPIGGLRRQYGKVTR